MKERKFYFMRTFVTNKKQNRKRGREKREEQIRYAIFYLSKNFPSRASCKGSGASI